MTDKEILQEVMKKYYFNAKEVSIIKCDFGYRVDVYPIGLDFPKISLPYECIIFTKEFAKLFFGEFKVNSDNEEYDIIENNGWIYHQHKMLEEVQKGRNPLLYLKEFL